MSDSDTDECVQEETSYSENVFHKFRLSKPLVSDCGDHKWLINGVSANSWFSPYGITDKTEKGLSRFGPVTDEIKIYLQERAQSAGAILGRRFYDINKQILGTDEILQGHNVYSKVLDKENNNIAPRFCGKNTHAQVMENKNKHTPLRPRTSYGSTCSKDTQTDTESLQPKVEAMKIRNKEQFSKSKPECFMCKSDCSGLYDIIKVEDEKIVDLQKGISNVATESIFRKSEDISESIKSRKCFPSLKNRIQSAPPSLSVQQSFGRGNSSAHVSQQIRCSNSSSTPSHMSTDILRSNSKSVPLYWRTRSNHHRKQFSYEYESPDDVIDEFRGSLLKPLLYRDGFNLKHSAGCPFKCKGCFKACLASSEYLENLQRNRTCKKTPIRPKFYHRKIVEMALAKSQPVNRFLKNKRGK